MKPFIIPKGQFRAGIHEVSSRTILIFVVISNYMFTCIIHMWSFVVSQMYCFRIEKIEGFVGEIRAPKKTETDYWVMEHVSVLAKPNSQVGDWSPPLYLLHGLPVNGALPDGTKKHHLFKKKMCKGNPLVQTPAELALKIAGLKRTVAEVALFMNGTWDVKDSDWWQQFWAERHDMPDNQHGVVGAPPDAVMLHRINNLLCGTGHINIQPNATLTPPVVVVVDARSDANFQALAALVTPTTEAAEASQWGRKRAVGFVEILPGETDLQAHSRAVSRAAGRNEAPSARGFI